MIRVTARITYATRRSNLFLFKFIVMENLTKNLIMTMTKRMIKMMMMMNLDYFERYSSRGGRNNKNKSNHREHFCLLSFYVFFYFLVPIYRAVRRLSICIFVLHLQAKQSRKTRNLVTYSPMLITNQKAWNLRKTGRNAPLTMIFLYLRD